MSCSAPKNCGECKGCKAASDLYERRLDVVHDAVEKEILRYLREDTGRIILDDQDRRQADYLAAGITNAVEPYLDMGKILPASNVTHG